MSLIDLITYISLVTISVLAADFLFYRAFTKNKEVKINIPFIIIANIISSITIIEAMLIYFK